MLSVDLPTTMTAILHGEFGGHGGGCCLQIPTDGPLTQARPRSRIARVKAAQRRLDEADLLSVIEPELRDRYSGHYRIVRERRQT